MAMSVEQYVRQITKYTNRIETAFEQVLHRD